jgi:transposase
MAVPEAISYRPELILAYEAGCPSRRELSEKAELVVGRMAMRALAIRDDLSPEELRRQARQVRDGRVSARMMAIANALDGMDRATAARLAGMDRQILRDWVRRYNAEGIAGLANRKAPGAKPKLSEGQMAALKARVFAGPDPAGDGVGRWRVADLCRWVAERWDVHYSETGMLRLLWALDLSYRKTRPRHPKSAEKAQQAFKKGALPRPCGKSQRRTRKPHGSRSGAKTRRGSGSRGAPATSGGKRARPHAGGAMPATSRPGSSERCARRATPAWRW